MQKVAKDEKFSRSTRKSFKKKCESMIPKDETGQLKLKIAGKYPVIGLKQMIYEIALPGYGIILLYTQMIHASKFIAVV